jgi:hypothetical protein
MFAPPTIRKCDGKNMRKKKIRVFWLQKKRERDISVPPKDKKRFFKKKKKKKM